MSTFGTIVGYVVIIGAVMALVAVAIGFLLFAWERVEAAHSSRVRSLYARDLGIQLCSSAWWFGEVPQTRLALHLIGESLQRYENFNVDSIREEWRQRTATEPTP